MIEKQVPILIKLIFNYDFAKEMEIYAYEHTLLAIFQTSGLLLELIYLQR